MRLSSAIALFVLTPYAHSAIAQLESLEVPNELVEQISLVAERQGRSVELVLQDAIQQYLSRNPASPIPQSSQLDEIIDPINLSTSLVLDDGTEVVFHFKTDLLWTTSLPNIQVSSYSGNIDRFIRVSANGESVSSNRPYFKSKSGSTVKVSIEAAEISQAIKSDAYDNWSVKVPREPMNLRISLTAADKTKTVSVPVRDAGLTSNTIDALVNSHGVGDHDHEIYVGWPDSKRVDGVFYSAGAGRSISRTHWKYNSMPGLVVCLNDSTIERIHSYPEVVEFGYSVKLYKDSDLTEEVNKSEFTLRPGSMGRDRLLERTPKAVAVASYKDDGYVKLWVPAEDAVCPHLRCPKHSY